MENAIWLIILVGLFIGVVFGGFWVIAKAGLPKFVGWIFGGIVLVIAIFVLVNLAQNRGLGLWIGR